MLISIETHTTCDFSGGSGPSIPLDPHMVRHVTDCAMRPFRCSGSRL